VTGGVRDTLSVDADDVLNGAATGLLGGEVAATVATATAAAGARSSIKAVWGVVFAGEGGVEGAADCDAACCVARAAGGVVWAVVGRSADSLATVTGRACGCPCANTKAKPASRPTMPIPIKIIKALNCQLLRPLRARAR